MILRSRIPGYLVQHVKQRLKRKKPTFAEFFRVLATSCKLVRLPRNRPFKALVLGSSPSPLTNKTKGITGQLRPVALETMLDGARLCGKPAHKQTEQPRKTCQELARPSPLDPSATVVQQGKRNDDKEENSDGSQQQDWCKENGKA